MNATLFSLLAITLAFSALVVWVYWPSRRGRLESLRHIPLETDDRMPSMNAAASDNDTQGDAHE